MYTKIYTCCHYYDPETNPDVIQKLVDGFESGAIKLNNFPSNCYNDSTKVLVYRQNNQIIIQVSKKYPYSYGDMSCSRYAQKSTIVCLEIKDEDMTFKDPIYVPEDEDMENEPSIFSGDEEYDIPELV